MALTVAMSLSTMEGSASVEVSPSLSASFLTQHAPHHLTRARLGQPRDDHDAVEDGEPANLLAHRHLKRGHEVGGLGDALGQDDVRKDALALDVVRGERRLDLGGALALRTSSQGRGG